MEALREKVDNIQTDVRNLEKVVYGSSGHDGRITRVETTLSTIRGILIYIAVTLTGLATTMTAKLFLS